MSTKCVRKSRIDVGVNLREALGTWIFFDIMLFHSAFSGEVT
jgi:hypothetical protein